MRQSCITSPGVYSWISYLDTLVCLGVMPGRARRDAVLLCGSSAHTSAQPIHRRKYSSTLTMTVILAHDLCLFNLVVGDR